MSNEEKKKNSKGIGYRDTYRLLAAEMFGLKYEEVREDHRLAACQRLTLQVRTPTRVVNRSFGPGTSFLPKRASK